MTTPNIDMKKLREVSVEAAKLQHEVQVCNNLHNQIGLGKHTLKYWPAIAATMLKLAEENERLREFTQHALDLHSWDNEPDGGDLQDKAEELKLIELRPIDPEDAIDDETEQYFCVWTPKAARQGVNKR